MSPIKFKTRQNELGARSGVWSTLRHFPLLGMSNVVAYEPFLKLL